MMNKKSAFTLAEVLLVLAIIGVIAAVTIPAIMQQSSEKKFSALAKKSLSTLQNAIDLKLATTPIGPGDMGVGLLQWLIDGEEDGTSTLKVIKKDNEDNPIAIQTPDGMIYYARITQTCSTASTKTRPLGCLLFHFVVDLNGADGPTKTTVENAETLLYNISSDNKAYDVIRLMISGNTRVKGYTASTIGKRTKKYLGVEN